MQKRNLFVILVITVSVVLAACAEPEPEMVEVIREVKVPQTVEVTEEVTRIVAETIEVTRIEQVVVTATPTPTPVNSPTPTNTPTVTPTPTNTPPPTNTPTQTPTPNVAATATAEAWAQLTAPKGDGFYLVGREIAPGLWESQGSGDDCYWARLDSNQEILDNHYGRAGGTVRIRATDFEVEFDDCGQWIYLGQ